MSKLTIATFNVNSIRSRLDVLSRWLSQNPIDILGVQETKTQDSTFPLEEIQNMGYHCAFRGQKSYNGVAILFKKQPDQIIYGFDHKEAPDDTRLIQVKFGPLWINNVYVPQGKSIDSPDYIYKKEFLSDMKTTIDKQTKDPKNLILWMGDMNVAPTEIDVTHPENKKNHPCFTEEIRQIFQHTTQPLQDVLRKYHPEEGQFSFFDYRVKGALSRNIGWRIDFILASKALATKSQNCWIDREPRSWEKPSDHTPVVAEFDV